MISWLKRIFKLPCSHRGSMTRRMDFVDKTVVTYKCYLCGKTYKKVFSTKTLLKSFPS